MENEKLVRIENKQIVVSSREICKHFEKQHYHVMRDIEVILGGISKFGDTSAMFELHEYVHEQNGQKYKEYIMNRDAFTLVAMGFSGAKALEWKLKYIQAFNLMEKEISLLNNEKEKAFKNKEAVREQELIVRKQNARVRESNQYLKIAAKVKDAATQYLLYAKAAESLNGGVPVLPPTMPIPPQNQKTKEPPVAPKPSPTASSVTTPNTSTQPTPPLVKQPEVVQPTTPSQPAPLVYQNGRRTLTATDIGKMFGGINASRIGKIANDNHLKTPQYGKNVYSRLSNGREVSSWRYYDTVIPVFRELLKGELSRRNRQTKLWNNNNQNADFDLI